MSRITKRICKALSIFLSLVLLVQFLYLQGLPTLADAAETPSSTTTPDDTDLNLDTTIELLGEDVSRREENVKHYFLSNHTSRAIVYAEPVHYEVDGEWQEIDNTLSSESALDSEDFNGFVNLANSFQVKFANNTNSSKLVRLRKDNYEIAWGYDGNKVSGNVKSKSKKQVTTPDSAFTVPMENALGQIDYPYVQDNTSLQYIVSGSGVKENIVIHSATDSYAYTFSMKVKNVTLSLLEDGSVVATATDTGETVFAIPAPFMVDANHRYSNAVSYSLTQNGNKKYTLTIAADAEWINSDETAFPVVIDPIIHTEQDSADIDSTFIGDADAVKNLNLSGKLILSTGWDTAECGHTRTLLKFALPSLNRGDMVVYSQMALWMYHSDFYTTELEDQQIGAHMITSSWERTEVTWNTKPSAEAAALDYNFITHVSDDNWKKFDITRAVKTWYETPSANHGIMVRQTVESETGMADYAAVAWYWSEKYNDDTVAYPVVFIDYRNNKGLENYWTYTGLSAGTAGSAYINDYSGNLVFSAPLLSSPSQRMPLNLIAYHNGYAASQPHCVGRPSLSSTSLGRGWRLNIQQTVLPSDLFGLTGDARTMYPYVYTDADGTDHYFKRVEEGETITYVDEDGLGLTLTVSGVTYIITNEDDDKWYFNNAGNLYQIEDANGNTLQIVYDTPAGKINYVLDGTGHKYTFMYSGYFITGIRDMYNRVITFTRSNNALTKIVYPDGITSVFAYTSDFALSSVQDNDGHQLAFSYTDLTNGKQVKEVQEYSEPDENGERLTGQKITFDRQKYNQTVIRTAGPDGVFGNSNDLLTVCQFDNSGRTNSSQVRNDGGGNTGASVTRYTEPTSIKQVNRVESSVTLGKNVMNLVLNGDTEAGMSNWTSKLFDSTATVTSSTAQAYFGNKSIAINNTAINALAGRTDFRQDVTGLIAGGIYTFSAYVKIAENAASVNTGDSLTGAYISAATQESETSLTVRATPVTETNSTINDGWQRLSVTVTLPTDCTELRVYLCFRNMTGTAYFDGIQLEYNSKVHPFNLLQNGGYEKVTSGLPTGWQTHNVSYTASGTTVQEGITTAVRKDLSHSLRVIGDASKDKYVYQTVPVAGNPDDTYIISGWAGGYPVNSRNNTNAAFEIAVTVNYTTPTGGTYSEDKPGAKFNTTITGWQYSAQPFSLRSKEYPTYTPISITIKPRYAYQANYVYFDFLQLIREPAPTYTYNDDGELISAVANAEQKSEMTYEGADLEVLTNVAGYDYNYDYDENHNLTAVTLESGLKASFSYNAYGQALDTVFSNADNTAAMTSNIAYSSGFSTSAGTIAPGTRIVSTSNADGYQTSYSYDALERLIRITAPNGATKNQTYVSNTNRVAAISSSGSQVSYAYDGARLSAQTFGDNTFAFSVDRFGNKLSTSVNGVALFTNTYAASNGLLQKVTYANGAVNNYSYNWLGQLLAIGNGTSTLYSWQYDDNGTLMSFTDLVSARKFLYTRDSLNRPARQQILSTSGGTIGATEYGYDIRNNVTRFVVDIGGYEAMQQYLYSAIDGQTETENYAKDNLPTRYIIGDDRYIDYDYDSLNRLSQVSLNTARALLYNYSYYASERNANSSAYYQTNKLYTEIIDNIAYRYTYDMAGNITEIEKGERISGTNTADNFTDYYSFAYDSLGQLTRVNSVPENATYMYYYDTHGNITSKAVFPYASPEDAVTTLYDGVQYNYGTDSDAGWADLLTSVTYHIGGTTGQETQTIDYDASGNPLSYLGATLTWREGKRLASYTKDDTSVLYTYDADGLRTSKTVNGVKHEYLYEGNNLVYEKRGDEHLYYYYDSRGHLAALRRIADGENNIYYVSTNVQGDVMGLYTDSGALLVSYQYDAWGNLVAVSDSSTFNLAIINPIRYRGYYFDEDTGLYYLRTRYYDPELGRFINADQFVSTGSNVLGHNMFAYCVNNPIMGSDPCGCCWHRWDFWNDCESCGGKTLGDKVQSAIETVTDALQSVATAVSDTVQGVLNYINNDDAQVAQDNLEKDGFTFYNNTPVFSSDSLGGAALSFGFIVLGSDVIASNSFEKTLNHEYGHTVHYRQVGAVDYFTTTAIPSLIGAAASQYNSTISNYYYNLPWERTADYLGGVNRSYLPYSNTAGSCFYGTTLLISLLTPW